MEEAILKLRKNKKRLRKLLKLIKNDIDTEEEMIDSSVLEMMQIISKIDEEITDIIYIILDHKNS